jgi:chemotaxis protein CheC
LSNPHHLPMIQPMGDGYSEMEMSAIREIANIGTGTAATALGTMIGRGIDIAVPSAEFLPVGEVAERIGDVESAAIGVFLPVFGDVPAAVLLVFAQAAADTLCGSLGCEAASEMGHSALREIGNILAASYTNAIGTMTGLQIEPSTPTLAEDMLGSIVSTALIMTVEAADSALFMETAVTIEGEACDFAFLFLPEQSAIEALLTRLGLRDAA